MESNKLLARLFISWAEDCGWLEIVPATTLGRFFAYTGLRRAVRSAEFWSLLFRHFAFPDARHTQTLVDQILARILLGLLYKSRSELLHSIYLGDFYHSDVAAAQHASKLIEKLVDSAIEEGRVYRRLSGGSGRGTVINPIRNWWE